MEQQTQALPANTNVPLDNPPPSDNNVPVDNTTKITALDQLVDMKSWSKAFKIHAAIAAFVSMITFGIWFFIALFVFEYPWFIFINCFFALSLSFHFFALTRREGFQCHLSFFTIINLMLLLVWMFSGEPYPWFIIVFFSMAIPLAIHYAARTYHDSKEKRLYIHYTFWASVNALCFAAWIMGNGYPWFFHVVFTSAFFIIAHYCSYYYQGSQKWFLIHAGFFVNLQLYMFFIWASSGMGFPWFVFVFVPLAFALFLHYKRYKGTQKTSELPQTYTTVPYTTGAYQNVPITVTTTGDPQMMLYPPQQPIYVPASALVNAQPIFVAPGVAPPPYSTVYGVPPQGNNNTFV